MMIFYFEYVFKRFFEVCDFWNSGKGRDYVVLSVIVYEKNVCNRDFLKEVVFSGIIVRVYGKGRAFEIFLFIC